ncbi:RNA polymerase recycling motor ATPase HelR [Gordonia caeni]|uniref:RNA polymerase recycling motor ATPase HelR n=1 Tax=Gordonia caeni TaxID=1007097 RepID=A0ABP7P3S2_9ACTN
MPPQSTYFDLPDSSARKAAAALIADDDARFAAIDAAVAAHSDGIEERLDTLYRTPARGGREAAERDAEIRGLTARLKVLRRRGAELCLGRMTAPDGTIGYLGRIGVTDADGRDLLLDWRTPAAAPFFAASRAQPCGLAARRRYRWSNGRVSDYWDEALTDDALRSLDGGALDAESSFLAALGAAGTGRMRDVLATLAAEQDAIIRDRAGGTLVVDGGPGTGKTVVALHRAAYLLYADPRVTAARGGVLFVGPTPAFLSYVADVLPDLGEEGTRFATLRDLTAEGAGAIEEPDRRVAELKAGLTAAIERAVAFYEDPPDRPVTVETDWADVTVTARDWAVAFDAVEYGTPHNEARGQILDALTEHLAARHPGLPGGEFAAALAADRSLLSALHRAWPLLDARDVVGDLWTVPAYLRLCAPALSVDEAAALHRPDPQHWTVADLPLLDAARHRLGDKDFESRDRRRSAAVAEQQRVMGEVLDELVAADDDREGLVQQFAFGGMGTLVTDETGLPVADPDRLAGPFAHVVVDEAQDLTDAEWAMLARRCPAGGFTVVGDRAQSRRGDDRTWRERLTAAGLRDLRVAALSVNYRTPREVMEVAAEQIRPLLPSANIGESIRSAGRPVRRIGVDQVPAVLDAWLAGNDGVAAVIGGPGRLAGIGERARVRALLPSETSGLEFDLVVAIAPGEYGSGLPGAVNRYIAMTRTTGELVIAE